MIKGTIDPSINIENKLFMLPEKYRNFINDLTEDEAKTILAEFIKRSLKQIRERQTDNLIAEIKENHKLIIMRPK